MAEQESQQEPTMEEILASIRRIISEDDEEDGGEAPAVEAEAEEAFEAPAEEAAAEPEEVLELTQKVNEDGSVSDVVGDEDMVEAAVEEEPVSQVQDDDLVMVDEEMPEPAAMSEDAGEVTDESLLSNEAAGAAAAYFGALAQNVKVSDGKSNTLEHIVQELLRPMLKGWLDENLPAIVEELVREEIERLSRRGRLG